MSSLKDLSPIFFCAVQIENNDELKRKQSSELLIDTETREVCNNRIMFF